MAWYKQPIQPIDPIVKDPSASPPEQSVRYLRDNFDSSGQDSNTLPPAQDPAQWEQLLNIQPITQGALSRRWGYSLFSQFPNASAGSTTTLSVVTVGVSISVQVVSLQGLFIGQTITIDTAGNSESVLITNIKSQLIHFQTEYFVYALFTKNHAAGVAVTWGGTNGPATRMYTFQNNISLGRKLVYCASGTVFAGDEFGDTPKSVLTPTSAVPDRMVDSRNYAYFYNGTQADLKKWDGGLRITNWGIGPPTPATINTNTGAIGGTADAVSGSGVVWSNQGAELTPGNIPSPATATAVPPNTTSQLLDVTGFGFTVPSNAVITGITATIYSGTSTSGPPGTPSWNLQLLKNGVPYGNPDSMLGYAGMPGFLNTQVLADGLWGGNWLYSDINNANFGIRIYGKAGLVNTTFYLGYVSLQIFYSASTSAITANTGAAGNITLTVGRTYYVVFSNSSVGHFSDLNLPSNSTGPVTSSQINLTTIPVSPDAQVDQKIILATADGGDPSILYFVASILNSATTYTDNTPETTLLLNQQYLYTDPFGNEFGVAFNDPPPGATTISIKHKGRLWAAQQQNLYFSKALGELTLPNGFVAGKYEESWPPQNYFDISAGAETISGLFSDGNVIYIGTQSHIRRIFGDAPTNFQQPEICHQDVGVLNQETWVNVYLEGTPTGFMWLTPDFKVLGSDGNTYLDVGHPIQDVLDNINQASATNAHAMFVQDGPYDLFMLAIPTGTNNYCDTVCVFNMRSQQWCIWTPTDQSTAMLFNVSAAGVQMWLFAAVTAAGINTYQYTASALQDRVGNIPVDFAAQAATSWMHLGSPTQRKVLDELEVIGDPSMLVTVLAASTQDDFNTESVSVVTAAPLVLSPFQQYKVYLAGKVARDRYYKLIFESSVHTDTQLLNSYSLRCTPWNSL